MASVCALDVSRSRLDKKNGDTVIQACRRPVCIVRLPSGTESSRYKWTGNLGFTNTMTPSLSRQSLVSGPVETAFPVLYQPGTPVKTTLDVPVQP